MRYRFRVHVPGILTMALLLSPSPASASPPQYEAIRVPTVGVGSAIDFNDDGLVLLQTGFESPMIWDSKIDSLYPAVAAFDTLESILVTGWNNSGQMYGTLIRESGDPWINFFWDGADIHELVADAEAPTDYTAPNPGGVNDRGDVYGSTRKYSNITQLLMQATVWQGGGDPTYLDPIAPYPDETSNWVTGSNAGGDMVGNMERIFLGGEGLAAPRAALWRGGTDPEDLGAPANSANGETKVWDINDSLWVVGWATVDIGGTQEVHAQMWKNGIWTDLHDDAVFNPSGNLHNSEALVVNNAGFVGGQFMSSFGPRYGAFLWYQGTTYVMDNLVVNADDFPPDGVSGPHIIGVQDINENGDLLVFTYSGSYVLKLLEEPRVGDFVVNSTGNAGDLNPGDGNCDTGALVNGVPECTLEAAIVEANANQGVEVITFDIPANDPGQVNGIYTILPVDQLSEISTTMTVDATTQPGFQMSPVVFLDGTVSRGDIKRPIEKEGFRISSDGSKVRGLAVGNWGKEGILITGDNNEISGCYLGVHPDGVTEAGNITEGVWIKNAQGNLIGGLENGDRCVISNNGRGTAGTTGQQIKISEVGATGNRIEGCYLGTNAAGTATLGNPPAGVLLEKGCSDNVVGGTVVGARNVISGHGTGVEFQQSSGNSVQGNFIGLNVTGDGALPNTVAGIRLFNSPDNTIGGITAMIGTPPGNVISGNTSLRTVHGIVVSMASHRTTIQGNFIGTDATGLVELGNKAYGVYVNQADSILVGGSVDGARNVISANGSGGLLLQATQGSLVQGNLIGLNTWGNAELPNEGSGVELKFSPDNLIGGITEVVGSPPGNVISGNRRQGLAHGVHADSSSIRTTIQGNIIGLDEAGGVDFGNGGYGIFLEKPDSTLVGALDERGLNVISGNDSSGVLIRGGRGARLYENLIGTNATKTGELENGLDGVTVEESSDNYFFENLFRGNHRNGLRVRSGENNNIERSRFFANEAIGIDLEPGGVSLNDLGDTDDGANKLQNFPYLERAQENQEGDLVQVRGSLAGRPNTVYRLDFFTNTVCDPSGHGEGEALWENDLIFVGTNVSGFADFDLSLALTLIGERPNYVTATAVDAAGNTSEFSNCLKVLPPPPPGYAFPFVVNSTGDLPDLDAGDNLCSTGERVGNQWECTLRAAIEETNALWGMQTVLFHIPGETDLLIHPQSPLPAIEGPLELNAQTQPGFNGFPIVVVDGSDAGTTPGLTLSGTGVGVQGLAIEGFSGAGLRLEGTGKHTVEGNRIGVLRPPNGSGFLSEGEHDVTRPSFPTTGGNEGSGIEIVSGENRVGNIGQMQGNVIAGNEEDGVRILAGEGNALLNNGLVGNGGLGINLLGGVEDSFGVTANDTRDEDSGPNRLQNSPRLTSARVLDDTILLEGSLESNPSSDYEIAFYAAEFCDVSSSGEGEVFLGSAGVTTNSIGLTEFSVQLALEQSGVTAKDLEAAFVTATAMDTTNNTSEFSPCTGSVVPVVLLLFEAVAEAQGVRLTWILSEDSDYIGFHLYRRRGDGDWMRVNDTLLTGGSAFEYVDGGGQEGIGHEYMLEGLSRTGAITRFPPVTVRGLQPPAVTLRMAENPVLGDGTVLLGLPEPTIVTLKVFDLQGRLVRVLGEGLYGAGVHEFPWDGRNKANSLVSAGNYWIQLRASGVTRTTRVTLLR